MAKTTRRKNLKIQMLARKMTDQWEGALDLFKPDFRYKNHIVG